MTEQRRGFSFNVPEWRGLAVSLGELWTLTKGRHDHRALFTREWPTRSDSGGSRGDVSNGWRLPRLCSLMRLSEVIDQRFVGRSAHVRVRDFSDETVILKHLELSC